MKNLLIILPLLFVFACGTDSNTEEEFEPYQIGTWLITSPETADWIGESSQSKAVQADTIHVTSPEDHNITIIEDTLQTNPAFDFVIIDSTLNTIDANNFVNGPSIRLEFDQYNSNFSLSPGGVHINGNSDRYRFELGYQYQCGDGFEDPEYFNLIIYEPEENSTEVKEVHYIYRLSMAGIKDTLEDLLC